MAERKAYIDILRGLATIGVIVIHVASNNWYGYIGSANWYIFTIYVGIARTAVPIFFMISGALFLADDKEISAKYMIKHIVRLFIFLVIWGVVYQLINGNRSFTAILKNILAANTQTHLWFIYTIVGIYAVTPFIKIFANHADKKVVLCALAVLFVFGSILPLCSNLSCFSILSIWLQKIQPGILSGYVGYFLLGYYLDKWGAGDKKNRIIIYLFGVLGCLGTIGAVILDCITTQILQERFWTYCMPGILLSSLAVFSYVKNYSSNCGLIGKVMSWISRYSLGIYGVHFAFIILLWKLGFTTFSFCGLISVPVITVIVLMLSLGAAYAMSKIPGGKYIV